MLDLRTSSSLLAIVANKLGYADILLKSGFGTTKPKCCVAAFGYYGSFGMAYVYANEQLVWIAHDGKWDGRRDASMYDELVRLLYNVLENGGHVNDGRKKLDASAVPEFMMECALNGIVQDSE